MTDWDLREHIKKFAGLNEEDAERAYNALRKYDAPGRRDDFLHLSPESIEDLGVSSLVRTKLYASIIRAALEAEEQKEKFETVKNFLFNSRTRALGTIFERTSRCTAACFTSYQPATVEPWLEFDNKYIHRFLETISPDDLNKQVPVRSSFGFECRDEESVILGFDNHVFPVWNNVAEILGLSVQVWSYKERLPFKARSRCDRWCVANLGGDLVPCLVLVAKTTWGVVQHEGYTFVKTYMANKGVTDKLNHQLQQVCGAIRLDAALNLRLGGVGVIFTDQELHGIFFVEDDDERDRQAAAACSGPAKDNGQAYQSGTALITRAYKFADGGSPSAEAALLALACFGKELREKAMGLQQPLGNGDKLAAQPGHSRRAVMMLPFQGILSAPQEGHGQVTGRVQLEEILGEGTCGVVHRGILDGQEVAIKLPRRSEKQLCDALEEEANLHGCPQLQPLQGSAIAQLIAAGTAAELPFLATELLGPSAADGPLTPEQEDAGLEALKQLHRAGILHGDPRAENLLLPRAGSEGWAPKWADLSHARLSDDPIEHAWELDACRSEFMQQRARRLARPAPREARPATLRTSPRATLMAPMMCAMPSSVRVV